MQKLSFGSQLLSMASHPLKIACLSGVRDPRTLQQYQQWLADLGITYKQSFMFQTDILIVSSLFKEKYKIWRSFNKNIPCVSVAWVEDSHRLGKILPTQQYEISTVFAQCEIGVCGFSEEQANRIKGVIEELGGVAMILGTQFSNGNRRVNGLKIDPNLEVLIMDKKFYQKICLQSENSINIPCVGLQWLAECRKKNICKYPLDYSYNLSQLKASKKERQLSRLKNRIEQKINQPYFSTPIGTLQRKSEENEKSDQTFLISRKKLNRSSALFKDFLIYLHPELIDHSLMATLKQHICLEQGMYIEVLTPYLSHIVVDNITEPEYSDLLRYGDCCKIVRVEWLIDSILFGVRMEEEDYHIFYFDKNYSLVSDLSMNDDKNGRKWLPRINQKSHSTLPSYNAPNPQFSSSISRIFDRRQSATKTKTEIIKKKAEFKSQLLKGLYFYIPSKFRKDKELKSLVTVIRQNAGIAYEKPKASVNMFCVIADCPDLETVYKEICQGFEKWLQPISPRWIYYCIKKGNLIDFSADNYFIFKPFKFKVPLFCFMTMKIQIVGVNDIVKIRVRQLVNQLGSKRMKPSIHEITHCLCGEGMQEEGAQKRINQIRQGNQKTKFLQLKWIFDCVNDGASVPQIQKYVIHFADQSKID